MVSVVVPTFNRGPALRGTLTRLLASEMEERHQLEIIVVDDGSVPPAREAVGELGGDGYPARWPLRWLRQANAGPAAARNAGFRAASGELVLFVDDDILVPPDLVRLHVAAHRSRPGAVIFGLCPFAPQNEANPFRAYLEPALMPRTGAGDGFVPASIVASGQISVERSQFAAESGVYSPEMVTPAAEEYELALRLRQRGIPIFAATGIVALHDQPVDIASYCRQQYKHGLGCGEAAVKRPDLRALRELDGIIQANQTVAERRGRAVAVWKRVSKTLSAQPPVRGMLLRVAQALERTRVPARLRAATYRAAIAAHFVAGVRDGLSRYRSEAHEPAH
jgi:GT2 family glycosyltransferase